VSQRPLVLVSGLTIGDYLLWNWSLNASHAVIALISGLTLPPLALATLWLLALSLARVIARTARRSPATRRTAESARAPSEAPRPSAGALAREKSAAAQSQAATGSSGKLAA
jgi:hypothetical protein